MPRIKTHTQPTSARLSASRSQSKTTPTGADFRALRHRIKQLRDENYSAARFARDLNISESLLQFIETGQRNITPNVARAYRRVERDYFYCLKEDERADAATATWLVDALLRHLPHVTPRDRTRLKRGLK